MKLAHQIIGKHTKRLKLIIILVIINFNYTLLYAQNPITKYLNISLNESLGFNYKGFQKDDDLNTEYFFEYNYEDNRSYRVVILNVIEPKAKQSDTELLEKSRLIEFNEGKSPKKVNKYGKVFFEHTAKSVLGDDNRVWYAKLCTFVYKGRLYTLFVSAREEEVDTLLDKYVRGIKLI